MNILLSLIFLCTVLRLITIGQNDKKLTLQRKGRELDRDVVRRLQPAGQHVLLQLQEQLVPAQNKFEIPVTKAGGGSGCRIHVFEMA